MGKRANVIGEVYNGCVIVADAPDQVSPAGRHQRMVEVVCPACGEHWVCLLCSLTSGHTTKCRECAQKAFRRANSARAMSTGLVALPEDQWPLRRQFPAETSVLAGATKRCHDPNSKDYPSYGAKGVIVCDRWRNNLKAFLSDVGPRPTDGRQYELSRGKLLGIADTGNYEPGNVSWKLKKDNQGEKGGGKAPRYIYEGKLLRVRHIQPLLSNGLSYGGLYCRIKRKNAKPGEDITELANAIKERPGKCRPIPWHGVEYTYQELADLHYDPDVTQWIICNRLQGTKDEDITDELVDYWMSIAAYETQAHIPEEVEEEV